MPPLPIHPPPGIYRAEVFLLLFCFLPPVPSIVSQVCSPQTAHSGLLSLWLAALALFMWSWAVLCRPHTGSFLPKASLASVGHCTVIAAETQKEHEEALPTVPGPLWSRPGTSASLHLGHKQPREFPSCRWLSYTLSVWSSVLSWPAPEDPWSQVTPWTQHIRRVVLSLPNAAAL